ncbi:beta-1,6-N-acetylglucosaminyltransferase [Chitinophaga sancti]|uniref:Peptide O-xylosyltransferase n=1 Tax=Chitinophaga sancti TaxID=1004 RepID=A0A1K1SPT7_9BACT|nr:beta-1,6-N-acetylglucosaminyltransferase [Chitinophaga sancti]WQD64433.1 beta-1,6-N-acetylglucosaminyltransferase [Chitinophaga sancti]WQG89943.1 beta-1,6-N-acetylglucosaminyltransferase [Chitinophaga sancti]SFW86302.1 Core-2/I-Branching enzyme [Chitinophaga sancti]
MRIAYLILAHRNISQLSTLIDLLTTDTDNFCFIHLDAKIANNRVKDLVANKVTSGKYKIIKNAIDVKWGGFSMIEASLHLIKGALKHKKIDFDYFALLSGMDLPIKDNNYIDKYLISNSGEYYLENFKIPNYDQWSGDGGKNRLEHYWFVDELGIKESTRLVKCQKDMGLKREMPRYVRQFYGGSQWWTISRRCAEFVMDFVNNNAEVYEFFKRCLIPDELFFHTIIMNSRFASRGYNNNLRCIDWASGPEFPKVFDISDFDFLITHAALYARKFDILHDADIMAKIINHIKNRPRE